MNIDFYIPIFFTVRKPMEVIKNEYPTNVDIEQLQDNYIKNLMNPINIK